MLGKIYNIANLVKKCIIMIIKNGDRKLFKKMKIVEIWDFKWSDLKIKFTNKKIKKITKKMKNIDEY